MRRTPLRLLAEQYATAVKWDRGETLYCAKAGDVAALRQAGFAVTEGDGLLYLSVTQEMLPLLLEIVNLHDTPFPKTDSLTEAEIPLLHEAVKQYEAQKKPSEDLEKRLRQCCAVCMRNKKGGKAIAIAHALTRKG